MAALNDQLELRIQSDDGTIGNITNIKVSIYDYDDNGIQLYDDLTYNLTFQVFDLENLENRSATYSKTITIPGTSVNNKIFSNLFDIDIDIITDTNLPTLNQDVFFNKKIECELMYDSYPIKEGFFELRNVSYNHSLRQIEYEGQFYSKSKDFSETVGDKLLLGNSDLGDDLNFSMYDHPLTMENFVASHTGTSYTTSTGYYYPVIDYVNLDSRTSSVEDYRPSLYVKEIIDKIFEKAGYSYTSTFFESDYYKSLIIPWTGSPKKDDEDLELRNMNIGMNDITGTNTDYTGDGSVVWGDNTWGYLYRDFWSDSKDQTNVPSKIRTIPFDKDTPDPLYNSANDDFDTATNKWVVPSKGQYRIGWTSTQNIYGIKWDDGSGGIAGLSYQQGDKNIDVSFQIWKNNNTLIFESPEKKYLSQVAGDTWVQTWTSSINWSGLLLKDDEITFKISLRNKNTWVNEVGQTVKVRVWLNVVSDTSVFKVESLSSYNLYAGEVVEMNKALPPSTKQMDFFKQIINMFNLVVDEVKNEEKKLLIETRDDYYESGSVLDWTDKEDISQPETITRIPTLINKDFKMSYTTDSDDYNSLYQEEHRDLIYGNRVVKNPYLSEDVYEINTNFSPTPLDNLVDTNWAVSKIYTTNDRDELQEGEYNTRILFRANIPTDQSVSNGKLSTTFIYNGEEPNSIQTNAYVFGDITNYPYITNRFDYQPYAGHLDNPYNPTYDLNFDVADQFYYSFNYLQMTDANVYDVFWKNYIAELIDINSKKVTKYIKLDITDIYDFDFSSKVWVDNVAYIVEKIYDWNPGQITKVDLLKLSKYDLDLTTPSYKTYIIPKIKPKPAPIKVIETYQISNYDEPISAYLSTGTISGVTSGTSESGYTIDNYSSNRNEFPDSSYGIIIGQNNVLNNESIFVKGFNNTISSGATNVNIFGDNNIVEDGVSNVDINGNDNIVKSGSTDIHIIASNITIDNDIHNVFVNGNDAIDTVISTNNYVYSPTGYTYENVYTKEEIDSDLSKIGLKGSLSFEIRNPETGVTYTIELSAPYDYTVNSLVYRSDATPAFHVDLNNVKITGLDSLTASTSKQTASATALNDVVTGDDISVYITNLSTSTHLDGTINITKV